MIKKHIIGMMLILLVLSFVFPTTATSVQYSMISDEKNHTSLPAPGYNTPPDPPLISGPTECIKGVYYDYQFILLEPDEDDFLTLLEVDFGNEIKQVTKKNCEMPWYNGTDIWMSHSWQTKGDFEIKARAMDSYGEWSNWSEPYPVTLTKQKIISHSLLDYFELFPFFSLFLRRFT